jgi:hypothetical protein
VQKPQDRSLKRIELAPSWFFRRLPPFKFRPPHPLAYRLALDPQSPGDLPNAHLFLVTHLPDLAIELIVNHDRPPSKEST